MRVEVLEYGDNPESEYPEDFNSFKVMTIWSEPETEAISEIPSETEVYESPEESPIEPKRLVTAVEFHMGEGGFFFIERPMPDPNWLNKVFDLLREKGWEGYSFQEIRGNCRGDIEIINKDDYTAVIDRKKNMVLHDRDLPKGSGRKEDLEEWKK